MVLRLCIQTLVWIVGMGVLLFLPAGTLNWPGGWAFLIEIAVLGLACGLWMARRDPALLAERLKPPLQKEQPGFDRLFMTLVLPGFGLWFVVMGLDAGRFHWSSMPVWGHVIGGLLLALAVLVAWMAVRENSFASAVAKLQPDRGQSVISTGLYAQIRHPMYAGGLLLLAGTPLLLGSWWGLALAPSLAWLLGWRALHEEAALRDGLTGYRDYAKLVRWRFAPGVW